MKKIAVALLVVMLLCLLVGCGSFSPPTVLPDPVPDNAPDEQTKPDDKPSQDDVFTVKLVMNEQPFYPTSTMFALWTGEEGVHRAVFDEEGVATITGLDGEYHVTLSGLPVGYTYDPNGYFADNENMSVTVEVLHIVSSTASDKTSMYSCVDLSSLGTYRTQLTSASHKIWFTFTPEIGGIYSIESWVDTTENTVNPYVDIYNGTFAFKWLDRTQNDGGNCSTYTKNFRFEWSIAPSEVGNLVSFVIYADSIGNNYPVTVDFTIKYEGEVPDIDSSTVKVHPEGPFNQNNQTAPGTKFRYIYEGGTLTDDGIVFNEADGYYHIYNSETGEQGAVLYATISSSTLFLDGDGFMNPLVVLKFAGYDYYEFIEYYDYWSDPNKRHPVTEELKRFLYLYSQSQHFFYDGNGWGELLGIGSTEEDQWLFNCGYYI